MPARPARELFLAALVLGALLLPSCRTTVDSLGSDRTKGGDTSASGGSAGDTGNEGGSSGNGSAGASTGGLGPLVGPASYPNYFREILGKTDAEINTKISGAFNRLFHGDSNNEAVYFTVGSDQALVRDILHGDVRTEGIAWGMNIAVQLNKQDEFDRLWAYAKSELAYPEGDANYGFFRSFCDIGGGGTEACADPFGFQQLLMALVFARTRFGSAGRHDYEADAIALFEMLKTRAAGSAGTPLFDPTARLVYHLPNAESAGTTRPSIEMPAFYELFAQATGEAAYTQAASAARAYFRVAAHPSTGLLPVKTRFDGGAIPGSDTFAPEAYRAQINLALDRIFFNRDAWQVEEAQRLLAFFASKGIDDYGQIYSLDGASCSDPCQHDPALVAVNGVTAALAPASADRTAFVQAVWDLAPPSGLARYYPGMLHLISLLILGGQYRVY